MEQSDTTPPDIDEVETEPEKTSKAQEPELDLDLVPSESTQAIIDTGKYFNLHTGKSSFRNALLFTILSEYYIDFSTQLHGFIKIIFKSFDKLGTFLK